MSVSITFDITRFQKDFEERVARSESALPVVTNRVALDVNKIALQKTQKADRAKIEQLGVSGYQFASKRGGKLLKRRKILYGDTDTIRMRFIYIAQLRRAGINPESIAPGEMEKQIKRALGRRLSAISYMSSRFVPVLRKLMSELHASDAGVALKTAGGPSKSTVTVAVPGWSPSCAFSIIAEAHKDEPVAGQARMVAVMKKGMEDGFNGAADNMEKYVSEQLNKVWKS